MEEGLLLQIKRPLEFLIQIQLKSYKCFQASLFQFLGSLLFPSNAFKQDFSKDSKIIIMQQLKCSYVVCIWTAQS